MPRRTNNNRRGLNLPAPSKARFSQGMKSRQLGYGEELFLLFLGGVGLLFLVVYGLALWIGRGWVGKLIGVAIATALLSPIWLPVVKSSHERNTWDSLRDEGARICEMEIASQPNSVQVDSVLDDVGALRSGDLQYLLVNVGIMFVEVFVKPNGNLTDNEDSAWTGDAKGKPYAHLQLGNAGSPDCYIPKNRDEKYFFTAAMPVKPTACLQVTYLSAPTAVDEIVEIQGLEPKRFSRWTLRDRYSGAERVGVSDAFRLQQYPSSQTHWDRRGNQNFCQTGFSGYGMLLDRVQGTASSIAYSKQFLLTSGKLSVAGLPASYLDLRKAREERAFVAIHTQSAPFSGEISEVRNKATWIDAYQTAVKQGAAVNQNRLFLPGEGKVLDIFEPGFGGKWGTTGSQLIYATPNDSNVGDERVLLFGVDFDGKHLWSAQTTPLKVPGDGLYSVFLPERFENAKDAMLIHGIYECSGTCAEKKVPWTIRIPLSELKALEVAAQKTSRK